MMRSLMKIRGYQGRLLRYPFCSLLILILSVFSGCSKKNKMVPPEQKQVLEGGFAVDLKRTEDQPALRGIFAANPPQEPSLAIATQTANLLRRVRENCTSFLYQLETPILFDGRFINGHFILNPEERKIDRGDKKGLYECIEKELPSFVLKQESEGLLSARLSIQFGDEQAEQ